MVGLPAIPLAGEAGAGLVAGLLLPLWALALGALVYAAREARARLARDEGKRRPAAVRGVWGVPVADDGQRASFLAGRSVWYC